MPQGHCRFAYHVAWAEARLLYFALKIEDFIPFFIPFWTMSTASQPCVRRRGWFGGIFAELCRSLSQTLNGGTSTF